MTNVLGHSLAIVGSSHFGHAGSLFCWPNSKSFQESKLPWPVHRAQPLPRRRVSSQNKKCSGAPLRTPCFARPAQHGNRNPHGVLRSGKSGAHTTRKPAGIAAVIALSPISLDWRMHHLQQQNRRTAHRRTEAVNPRSMDHRQPQILKRRGA